MDTEPQTPYPPGLTKDHVKLIPRRHREDAIQEAWVAHLEGRCPVAAADRYRKQEARYEKRRTLLPHPVPEDGLCGDSDEATGIGKDKRRRSTRGLRRGH